MKKLVFIGILTILAVTLALGIATLHAGQTGSRAIAPGPGWGPENAPQQDGGWYSPNNSGWQQRFRDWAYGMMGRDMGSGMRGRGWGMGTGCQ